MDCDYRQENLYGFCPDQKKPLTVLYYAKPFYLTYAVTQIVCSFFT